MSETPTGRVAVKWLRERSIELEIPGFSSRIIKELEQALKEAP